MPGRPPSRLRRGRRRYAVGMRPRDEHPLVERWDGGVHRLPVQMRFRDTDMFGHVNNVVFGTWIEIARIAFMRGLEPPSGDLILARLEMDFVRQVTFGQRIEVQTRVAGTGRTSVRLAQTVTADGEVASRVASVVVLYDYERMAARPIPDAYRNALAPYRTEEGEA